MVSKDGHNVPDLGAIARPQQLQVAAAVLARNAQGMPPELVDAAGLVEMMRVMVREELRALLDEEGDPSPSLPFPLNCPHCPDFKSESRHVASAQLERDKHIRAMHSDHRSWLRELTPTQQAMLMHELTASPDEEARLRALMDSVRTPNDG